MNLSKKKPFANTPVLKALVGKNMMADAALQVLEISQRLWILEDSFLNKFNKTVSNNDTDVNLKK